MEIPVYLFTGFLDSGKSTFIQSTLEDKRFNNGERTLVILCEEGEVELDASKFSGKNVTIHIVDDVSLLSPEQLTLWQKNSKAQRVMIEFNGMWAMDSLFQNLPKNWVVYQEMMFADANTFIMYNANMRERVVDKLQGAQLVVFNRAMKGFDKMPLHKIVRGVNRRVDIVYDYGGDDVEYDDIEDPLPFDKNSEKMEIRDNDFALWYRDLSDELQSYDGKVVTFRGQVVVDKSIPDSCFIIGRQLMTCCIDDVRFAGLVCEWDNVSALKNRDWVILTARIEVRKHKCYDRVGPVLMGVSVETTTAPDQEIATFD